MRTLSTSWRCGKPSVATKPGSTSPTCTPLRRSSAPSASVQPASANLEAEYAPIFGRARRPDTELTLTTALGADARSTGSSASVSRTTASKFSSIVRRTFS